jgi:hypothetical protein
MTPAQRLESILTEGRIRSRAVFGSSSPVICFTESTPAGLEYMINRKGYAPWGIVFTKEFVYRKRGGPVHYVREDEWSAYQVLPKKTRSRAVQIRPGHSEWMWEREWRVPAAMSKGFKFKPRDVYAVIAGDLEWPPGPMFDGPDGREMATPGWMPNTRQWSWTGSELLRVAHWPHDYR